MSPVSQKTSNMCILAIETSCDETAIALISAAKNGKSFNIISNLVSSQAALHAQWGGVVPNLAKREHQHNLPRLLLQVLKEANIKISGIEYLVSGNKKIQDTKYKILNTILSRESELLAQFQKHIIPLSKPPIDLMAVTQGPGLEPALWVGVNFARALSALWDIPLVGVNHMEGHIFSALLEKKNSKSKDSEHLGNSDLKFENCLEFRISNLEFPAITLLVSGGHTELVLIKKPLHYEIIGETRDDAAGEAFDKVARILGLGYPGGPAIAASAAQMQNSKIKIQNYNLKFKISLPRPMMHSNDYDFSFSGLKTAVLYLVRDLEKQGKNIKKLRPAIAKEFQDAVVDVLVSKTIRAAKEYKVKSILLGGGVAANIELRKRLGGKIKTELPNTKYYIPDTKQTGDNALMIATAAWRRAKEAKKTAWKTMKPNAGMRLF